MAIVENGHRFGGFKEQKFNSEVRVQVSVSGVRWVFSSEAIETNRSGRES